MNGTYHRVKTLKRGNTVIDGHLRAVLLDVRESDKDLNKSYFQPNIGPLTFFFYETSLRPCKGNHYRPHTKLREGILTRVCLFTRGGGGFLPSHNAIGQADTPSPTTVSRRRYASYWNTNWFQQCIHSNMKNLSCSSCISDRI